MEWDLNELKNAIWTEHAICRMAQRQKPGSPVTIDEACKGAVPYGIGMGGVHIWASACGVFPVVDHRQAKPRVLTVLTKGIANKTINNQQLLCMKPFREALHKISIGCDDPKRVAREALGIRLMKNES